MTIPAHASAAASAHPKWRADIDGLRAVAVSSVVLFHAFPRQLEGGYVGVDIFFVISGFLISSIIFGQLNKASFSFADFYARRVRRIFPALLLVLVSCYAFGWHGLLADEYAEFGKELAGGAGFVSNLVLWGGAGYFDSAAELKPLLHLWSLGIEEQFYMIWPLLLWLAWKRKLNFLTVTLTLAVVSFLFNLYLIQTDRVATFYSPLTRFWELLAGAALAYFALQKKAAAQAAGQPVTTNLSVANLQSGLGAALLLAGIFLLNKDSAFPGYWALLPVLGAVLMIAAGEQAWLNKHILSNKVMVWIGLISYPLYLWHWPLLVFPRIVEAEEPAWQVRVVAVAGAVILAWLTYTLIEKPVRNTRDTRKLTMGLSAAMVVVGVAGLATLYNDGITSRPLATLTAAVSDARQDRYYREPDFDDGQLDLTNVSFSGQSADKVLFLGDSLMAHYFSRVAYLYEDAANLPALSATFAARPGCRPIPPGNGANSSGKQCDEYYRAVMALAKSPEYKRVVFSASWHTVFSEGVYRKIGEAFAQDLAHLKSLGKDVVFISMAPHTLALDPTQLVRESRWAWLSGETVPLQGDRAFRREEIDFKQYPQWVRMTEFTSRLGISMIDPFDTLCQNGQCPYIVDGVPLYRDELHIRASVTRTHATYIDGLVGIEPSPINSLATIP